MWGGYLGAFGWGVSLRRPPGRHRGGVFSGRWPQRRLECPNSVEGFSGLFEVGGGRSPGWCPLAWDDFSPALLSLSAVRPATLSTPTPGHTMPRWTPRRPASPPVDVKDVGNIKLLSHVNTNPPFPGGTHTPLPLPGRKLAAISTSPAASPDRRGSIWLHFRMEHRSSSHRLYALIRRDIQVRRNWPSALGHHTHSACVAIERIGKAPPGGSCYSEAPSGNFRSKNQDGATSRADASE